jgi:hypothetical protein
VQNSNVSCVCDSIWSSGGVIVGTGGSPSPCVLSCDFNNILELLLDLDFGISSDEDLIPMISYTSGDTTYEVRIIPFNNDSTNANILVDFLIEDSIMCTYSVPIGVDGLNVYDCLFNLMADGYVSMEMDSFYISQQGCTITNLCNSIRAEAQNGEDGEDGVDGPAGEEGIYEEEDEGCIFEEEPMCIFMYPM